jgi:hypothetical protein
MAMSMEQVYALGGMGNYAAAIAAITGPLAAAGSDIYRTSSDSKQNRKELKQREREFQALIPVYERQQKQQALTTVAAVRQQQIVSGYQAVYAPYMLGAVAVGGLALIAIAVAKGGKKGGS